ncbi:MAG TPA: extracellular solute-binding protein [Firmicutes bacterium]|nr:extracellular solute-binding protein [Bacillota bacterium]
MKRIVMLALAALLLAVPVVKAEQITITYLTYIHHGDAKLSYLESKAREYEELHPNVQVDIIVGNQDKLRTMLAGGVDPDIHDLPDFSHLGAAGFYQDIMPLLQRDGLVRAYNPVVLNSMSTNDGKLYMVPEQVVSTVSFFNRDLFLASGVQTPETLGPGWNWDYLLNAGKKLTVDRNGDGTPESFGIDRGYAYWRRAIEAAGGDYYEFNAQGMPIKSLWTSPEVVTGLEYVALLWEEGTIPYGRVPRHEEYFFWTGKTAIDIVDAIAITGSYLSNVSFDWDMAIMPAGPAGPISSGAGGNGPFIFASTKNLEQVWDFCKFLFITRENVMEYAKITGSIPAYVGAQASYAAANNLLNKNYQAVFEALNYLPPRSGGTLPAELQPRSVNPLDAITGKIPVRQYLEQLHTKMQAIIDEQLGK